MDYNHHHHNHNITIIPPFQGLVGKPLSILISPKMTAATATIPATTTPSTATSSESATANDNSSSNPATTNSLEATNNNLTKNNRPSSSRRLSKTTASLPILYGSVALYLGKKADEFQTHEWTLYVRGPNHEDLSVAISKVVFQLHPSFPQPIRELSQPPFEVTERGWGEFEAQIRIHWKDPTEKPTIVCCQVFLCFVVACCVVLLLFL